MKEKFKLKKSTIIILIILIIALLGALIYDLVKYNKRITMPISHVFVCDDANHYSEFDNWLLNTAGVDKVPSYLIIYNHNVVGVIDGNVPEERFTDELGYTILNNEIVCELPDFQIKNIADQYMTLNDLSNLHSLIILEISWATCDDCIEQDKYFTKNIYNRYSTEQIYRYYIKSELLDVLRKHS